MKEETESRQFVFIGNQSALDFINTEIVSGGERISLIQNYADLAAWLESAHLIATEDLRASEGSWGKEEKQTVVETTLRLRAELREMAEALAAGNPVSPQTLKALNTLLRHPAGYAQVEVTASGYTRRFHASLEQPDDLLAPIVHTAADLLCDINPALVRKCENPACILYFYDNSKNHARRWCSMSGCGNRHKAATHYRRVRNVAKLQPDGA